MSPLLKLGIPCVLWDNNAITNYSSASEAHGYLDRSNNTWYEASEPVVDAMMAVMNDDSVVWGSESHLPTWKHADINSGDIIYENADGLSLIASDGNGGNCTPGLTVTRNSWAKIGKLRFVILEILRRFWRCAMRTGRTGRKSMRMTLTKRTELRTILTSQWRKPGVI